jgi:hypothetical protein
LINVDLSQTIQDPEKNPTADELEGLEAHPSLLQELQLAEAELEAVSPNNPLLFTDIQIDPEVLADERKRGDVPELIVEVEQEKDENEDEDEDTKSGDDTASIGSLDSIARQADFIRLIP